MDSLSCFLDDEEEEEEDDDEDVPFARGCCCEERWSHPRDANDGNVSHDSWKELKVIKATTSTEHRTSPRRPQPLAIMITMRRRI